MANPYQPLEPARIVIAAGIPRSVVYDDVYHSASGAFGQAEHVFLKGNGLPARWRGRAGFTVCETGFGLGRNFLALWRAWRDDPHRCNRLHVVSFELHPFSRPDLAGLLLPGLAQPLRLLGETLVAAWPSLLPGLHRLEFESGAVTLTLAFGPIGRLARQIAASVDAFFLDGFSPERNPEMWTPTLFGQMVRMANRGATAASWCCASHVRKALADAGFLVEKAPGFGRKREMTVATLRSNLGRAIPSICSAPERVLIVGGGPAGAGMARSLALRGVASLVIDPAFEHGRGASHRGHLAAAVTPRIARDDEIGARLSRAGVARAMQRWAGLNVAARPVCCGTLEPAVSGRDAAERQLTLDTLRFPRDWVRWLAPADATRLAGFAIPHGGVFFASGLLAQPEPLLESLLTGAGIDCVATSVARLVRTDGGGWSALDERGSEIASAPVAIVANAVQAKTLLASVPGAGRAQRVMSMQRFPGQVSYVAPGPTVPAARVIVAGDGYWLPPVRGLGVAGSTYALRNDMAVVTQEGHKEISNRLATMLGARSSDILARLGTPDGWAGQRAVATRRLPVIGRVAGVEGLWVACGYGSRGLTWSALAGDIVAAALTGEPLPLERALLDAVAP
ncbi:MAG TPA: tRNA (5-methylaminomethyl-2-thiouridine)(34)-methyltransferase MnmD [Burkholderiaceae bacterium]|nr:tRNA (5-methylaminomethyl-2-thiouridine)(34)-methyltransferase MnmD [Burkholderiaceae bacterium]